jgi:hypothetical protein
MTSLSDQAPEILDHILSFVANPKDILSLGSTTKKIYGVAIPDHIEFRHLRCDVRRLSVWAKLAKLPALASRFVSLEVVVENDTDFSPIVPTCLGFANLSKISVLDWVINPNEKVVIWGDITSDMMLAKCINNLVAALRCMSGLRRFHWRIAPPYQARVTEEVFAALIHCPNLEDIEIFPLENFNHYGVRFSL